MNRTYIKVKSLNKKLDQKSKKRIKLEIRSNQKFELEN